MTSSAGLQRFIISSYPSAEINFVEIHLCMLQCWLLKQSWKQTPCGGKEGGEQGEKKRKERKLWPQLTEIKLCSVTLTKRGWSPPHQKSRNRTDTLTKLLPVQFSVSLPQRRAKMPLLRVWTGEKVSIHNRISEGYHRLKCLLGCLSDYSVKLLYLVQPIESSEKS